MAQLAISEVAKRVGLRTSAIRYYERIGILPAAQRVSGQRRYDEAELNRLAVVQFARQTGFTLSEIRQLFHGFNGNTPASHRWKKLSAGKVRQLQRRIDQTRAIQALLLKLQRGCRCSSLEQCGRAWLRHACTSEANAKVPSKRRDNFKEQR